MEDRSYTGSEKGGEGRVERVGSKERVGSGLWSGGGGGFGGRV